VGVATILVFTRVYFSRTSRAVAIFDSLSSKAIQQHGRLVEASVKVGLDPRTLAEHTQRAYS